MWLPRARCMTDFQCICNYIVSLGRKEKKEYFSDFWLSQQGGRALLFSEKMENPERNIFKKGKLASDLQILSVR